MSLRKFEGLHVHALGNRRFTLRCFLSWSQTLVEYDADLSEKTVARMFVAIQNEARIDTQDWRVIGQPFFPEPKIEIPLGVRVVSTGGYEDHGLVEHHLDLELDALAECQPPPSRRDQLAPWFPRVRGASQTWYRVERLTKE